MKSAAAANPNCATEDGLTKTSIAITMGLIGVALLAAYFALRLVEKLQDEGVESSSEKTTEAKAK